MTQAAPVATTALPLNLPPRAPTTITIHADDDSADLFALVPPRPYYEPDNH